MDLSLHLPVYEIKDALLSSLSGCGQIVLSAPTGSGKSTQVPKMVLEALGEDQGRILVLQPRRLAARMLAERVAFELGVEVGTLVGYQTRYERVMSKDSRIVFITEGILTRMLIGSPSLPGISAIIFDEFHERSLHVDMGLAMAKHCRNTVRPDLKLVVMSATLETEPLLAYLPGSEHIHAEGRMYPVEISYMPMPVHPNVFMNAASALRSILNRGVSGDVLIFMPGGYEIRKTQEEIGRISSREPFKVLPLYGDLPPEAQRAVMEPCEMRKVIIATNIAETSLTIPGVRHVIDSGLVRINRYDSVRGVDMLETQKISRDSADQRSGRAGREAEGTCQRLWSMLDQSQKAVHSVPEIRRMDLSEAVMAVKSYGFHDIQSFPWYEAPPSQAMSEAERLLEQLGISEKHGGGLTELGRQLQSMPSHPRLSLLQYYGALHGCFREAALASALISGRPLVTGSVSDGAVRRQRRQDARQQKRHEDVPQSDFLVQISLLELAKEYHFEVGRCQELGVHGGVARDAWRAYEDFVRNGRRMGWDVESSSGGAEAFLRCILRAFPDRLAKRRDLGTLVCDLAGGRRGELSKDSIVREEPLFIAGELREVSGTGVQGMRLVLGLASGIREQWLWDDFEDEFVDGDEVYWDEKNQAVRRRMSLSCLGVLLEETLRQDPDPQAAEEMLAVRLDEGKLPLPNWDEDVERWISRVRWLRGVMPEHPLPEYDERDIAKIHRMLCAGETSYRAVKAKRCLDAVRHFLSGPDIQFVEEHAPAVIVLPKGRKMKIEYVPGQQPKGRAKIQDIYDMTKTIRVAGGRASILMDILAPNNRTVQITEDMESFWSVQYPKIKPQLSRRYPRHEWR